MTTNAMHDPRLEKKIYKTNYSNNWQNLSIDSMIKF